MKVEQKGHTTILKETKSDFISFLENITREHHSFKSQNLIIDLSHNATVTLKDIKGFSDLSKAHLKENKSFVIVAENLDYNAVPVKLTVVPSVLEAHDIIEMEEIERDLGF